MRVDRWHIFVYGGLFIPHAQFLVEAVMCRLEYSLGIVQNIKP